MAKTIHSMLRVRDEARSVAFYGQAFGLVEADRYDFSDFTLVYLRNPESAFELELTINKGRPEPYAIGDGYGHLAFSVADVEAERRKLVDLGFAPRDVKELRHEGRVLGKFFFVADPDGYMIEVLERGGRFV